MRQGTLWSHEMRLPAEAQSVPKARHFVRSLLLEHRIQYLVEDVRLVVSELATNAVRHANTPFAVTLERVDQSVVLTVTDDAPTTPVRRTADLLDTSGRGLSIVDLVSSDRGLIRHLTGGKSVWASFVLREDEATTIL